MTLAIGIKRVIGSISATQHGTEKFCTGGGGGGDMYKSQYDTDNDGRVDNAENVSDGSSISTAAEVKDAANKRHSNSLDHDHANKSTLDTYDQTNVNLTDAVTKKHSNSLDHSNANDPSAGEKEALAGTSGTPGSGNKYVTNDDSRNTNDRTPTTHDSTKHSVAYLAATAFSGLAKITVGTSPPVDPGIGDLWVDTN